MYLKRCQRRTPCEAKINDTDGVRIDLDEGWVHVRASNTEPIARIIAEAPHQDDAVQLCDEAAGVLAKA